MKLRLSLAARIGLWLVLNLVLLGVVAVAALMASGGLTGWIEREAGDRFRTVVDTLMLELNQEPAEDRGRLLDGYSADYGLSFMVLLNDGTWVAGAEIAVPDEVAKHLRPPPLAAEPLRPRPGLLAGGANPPLRADGQRPLRPDEPPPLRPRQDGEQVRPGTGRDGRILVHDPVTGAWWMGARSPVRLEPHAPPRPGTIFAVSDSALSFGALFDLRPILGAAGLVVVVSILFWLPLVVRMTRSLKTLESATGRIAEGKFDTRVPATRGDEIGRLGESVNVMAARLQTLVDGQKKFLADVAHELGSPLGRLQVGTSILEERVPEGLRQQVRDVSEEVEQMSALVSELLEFTRTDLGARTVPREVIKLSDVVTQVVEREGAGRVAKVEVPAALQVCAHGRLLERALGNVVRNAVRHGGEQVNLEIVARGEKDPRRVRLTVRDDGPGVAPEALARLGEPFYRPDESRQRETGGTGLGLSIVRGALQAMGGEVKFRNRVPHGLEVELILACGDATLTCA